MLFTIQYTDWNAVLVSLKIHYRNNLDYLDVRFVFFVDSLFSKSFKDSHEVPQKKAFSYSFVALILINLQFKWDFVEMQGVVERHAGYCQEAVTGLSRPITFSDQLD